MTGRITGLLVKLLLIRSFTTTHSSQPFSVSRSETKLIISKLFLHLVLHLVLNCIVLYCIVKYLYFRIKIQSSLGNLHEVEGCMGIPANLLTLHTLITPQNSTHHVLLNKLIPIPIQRANLRIMLNKPIQFSSAHLIDWTVK